MNLSKIKGGALQERFEMSLAKVLKNIADPNTDPKKKRTINIKLSFAPDATRDEAKLSFVVKESLEAPYELATTIIIDNEGTDAAEIGQAAPGQRVINTETGEILDTPFVENGKLQVIGK